MAQRLIGHRGKDDNAWTWAMEAAPPRRWPPRPGWFVSLAAGVLLAAAVGTPLGIVLTRTSDEGSGAVAGAPVLPSSRTPTATPARAVVPSPSPSPTPALGPTPSPPPANPPVVIPTSTPVPTPRVTNFRLAIWADLISEWRFNDLDGEISNYAEGEAIPFLLRIENAEPGTTYSVSIRYDCAANEVAAYDFLASYERDLGTEPALAEPGPGRIQPDATGHIPNDASIEFDDEDYGEDEGLLQLWAGMFASQPSGPKPDSHCSTDKLLTVAISAQAETVFLLWGGHLAFADDWGEDRGSSSLSAPFQMGVEISEIDKEGEQLAIDPRAIFGE